MQLNWHKVWCAGLVCSVAGMGMSFCLAAAPSIMPTDPSIQPAHTKPSQQAQLSFPNPGIIKSLFVKEGDEVKADDPLMQQDDEIEVSELERLEREAKSDSRVQYYVEGMEFKKSTLDRKTTAAKGTYNESEIQEAEADYKQAVQQIEVAKLDHQGDQSKADQQDGKVKRMKLMSPFDGIVEKVGIWPGEFSTPDREKYAILVVKNDPCYVELTTLWSWQVAKLSKGETMQVRYVGEQNWRDGKIIYISPVAQAESDNQIVRLELPNPEHKATGLPVEVKLPTKLLENNGLSSNEQKTALK